MTSGMAWSITLCVHVSFPAYHTEVSISELCMLLVCVLSAMLLSHNRLIRFICEPVILGQSRTWYAGGSKITLMAIMTADAEQRETFRTMSVDPSWPANQCQPALKMSSDSHPEGLKDRAGWGYFLNGFSRKQLFFPGWQPYISARTQSRGWAWVTSREIVPKGGLCTWEIKERV